MKIIDISWILEEHMACYPGNPPYRTAPFSYKDSTMDEIRMGNHTGTHVDAPRHALRNGATIEKTPLENLIGACRVLDMTHVRKGISVEDLKKERIKKGERILVKTKNSARSTKRFFDDFIYLEGEAAEFLAEKKLKLFGTDYLSVKKKGSEDNRPHTELLKEGTVIVEGLSLKDVASGPYILIALPLKTVGLDGAPARAVLIKGKIN